MIVTYFFITPTTATTKTTARATRRCKT